MLARLGLVFALTIIGFAGCAAPIVKEPQPTEPIYNGEARPLTNYTTEDHWSYLFEMPMDADIVGYTIPNSSHMRASTCPGCASTFIQAYAQVPQPGGLVGAAAVVLVGTTPVHVFHWGSMKMGTWNTFGSAPSTSGGWDEQAAQINAYLLDGDISVVFAVNGSTSRPALAFTIGQSVDFSGASGSAIQENPHIIEPTGWASGSFDGGFRSEILSSTSVVPPTPIIFVGSLPSYWIESGDVTVEERLPVGWTSGGGARSVRMESSCDLGGASMASVFWIALLEDTAIWEYDLAAGNQSARDFGVHSTVVLFDVIAADVVWGVANAAAIGNGAAHVELDWSGQMAPIEYRAQIMTFCASVPWSELLDVGDLTSVTTSPGLIGPLPPSHSRPA